MRAGLHRDRRSGIPGGERGEARAGVRAILFGDAVADFVQHADRMAAISEVQSEGNSWGVHQA